MIQNLKINQQLQRIEVLYKLVKNFDLIDPQLQAEWARYLTIRIAGFLENALIEIYSDFIDRNANPLVKNFAISHLNKIQNPNGRRFLDVAYGFHKPWGSDLEVYINKEGRKDAINSIMQNRHLIAHGKNSGITLGRLRGYFDKSLEVIEFIEIQCADSK